MARGKKKPPEVRAAEARYQRQQMAGRIKDRYPNVETIDLTLVRTDPDPHMQPGGPTTDTQSIGPNAYALVETRCGNRECTRGYHDLSEIIREMVANNEATRTGHTQCTGWQDAERVGAHQCLMQLDYTIDITYKSGSAA